LKTRLVLFLALILLVITALVYTKFLLPTEEQKAAGIELPASPAGNWTAPSGPEGMCCCIGPEAWTNATGKHAGSYRNPAVVPDGRLEPRFAKECMT